MVHARDPTLRRHRQGGSEDQGHPWWWKALETSLGYRRTYLKNAKSLAWACTWVTLTFGDWSRMIMTFVSTWAERSGFLSSVSLHE